MIIYNSKALLEVRPRRALLGCVSHVFPVGQISSSKKQVRGRKRSVPFGDPVNIGVQQKLAKLLLRKTDPKEVTQMVTDSKEDSDKTPIKQGPAKVSSEPNKIGPATPYDFDGKNLTAYGGLLPVGTLLEKLEFRQVVEETLNVKRQTRVMPWYQFILAMVLSCYVGFSRLHHLRFVQREPMLTEILGCCGSRRNVPSGDSWLHCTAAWPDNCWKCSGACGSE